MTPEKENERRANHIFRNAALYERDADFRKMVDNTTYISTEEYQKSALAVDLRYGVDGPLEWRTRGRYGA